MEWIAVLCSGFMLLINGYNCQRLYMEGKFSGSNTRKIILSCTNGNITLVQLYYTRHLISTNPTTIPTGTGITAKTNTSQSSLSKCFASAMAECVIPLNKAVSPDDKLISLVHERILFCNSKNLTNECEIKVQPYDMPRSRCCDSCSISDNKKYMSEKIYVLYTCKNIVPPIDTTTKPNCPTPTVGQGSTTGKLCPPCSGSTSSPATTVPIHCQTSASSQPSLQGESTSIVPIHYQTSESSESSLQGENSQAKCQSANTLVKVLAAIVGIESLFMIALLLVLIIRRGNLAKNVYSHEKHGQQLNPVVNQTYFQDTDNIIVNTHYEGSKEQIPHNNKMATIQTNGTHIEENTYYESADLENEKGNTVHGDNHTEYNLSVDDDTNMDQMEENTYYEGGPSDTSNHKVTSMSAAGNMEQPIQDSTYYSGERLIHGNGAELRDNMNSDINGQSPYIQLVGCETYSSTTEPHPDQQAPPVQPRPLQENYVYTYGHFKQEGRQREPPKT